jgi:hypothetical protein
MRPAALALAVAIGLTLVGTANAGRVTATYDLNGSTVTTNTPLGSDVDQITGQVTVKYDAATINAPISWAAIVAGNSTTTIQQTFGTSLVLTGSTTTVFSGWKAGGAIGTATVALPPAPGGMTGSIHCTGGLCGLAGFPASVPQPQTGPASLVLATAGGLVFTSGQAGLGDWNAVPYTVTAGAATLTFAYKGQEIGRSWVPEPGTASLLGLGLAALAGASSFTRRSRMR